MNFVKKLFLIGVMCMNVFSKRTANTEDKVAYLKRVIDEKVLAGLMIELEEAMNKDMSRIPVPGVEIIDENTMIEYLDEASHTAYGTLRYDHTRERYIVVLSTKCLDPELPVSSLGHCRAVAFHELTHYIDAFKTGNMYKNDADEIRADHYKDWYLIKHNELIAEETFPVMFKIKDIPVVPRMIDLPDTRELDMVIVEGADGRKHLARFAQVFTRDGNTRFRIYGFRGNVTGIDVSFYRIGKWVIEESWWREGMYKDFLNEDGDVVRFPVNIIVRKDTWVKIL